MKKTVIKLNQIEIISGRDRVQSAEMLINQLPPDHEGRNTWLLNYGVGGEAGALRASLADHGSGRIWDDKTESLVHMEAEPFMHPFERSMISEYKNQTNTQNANSIQVDGDHYKIKSIQPWDYVAANNLDFFQGNIIKYLTRWREKGGIKDLQKARHYLDKYLEVIESKTNDKQSVDGVKP